MAPDHVPSSLPVGSAGAPRRSPVLPGAADAMASHVDDAATGRLMPMFNDRFLFDDEFESSESTSFTPRYQLSANEDAFPMLLKMQSQGPPMAASASGFSNPLDLASLATAPGTAPGAEGGAPVSALSPWLPSDAQHTDSTKSYALGPIGAAPGLLRSDPAVGATGNGRTSGFSELFDQPRGPALSSASLGGFAATTLPSSVPVGTPASYPVGMVPPRPAAAPVARHAADGATTPPAASAAAVTAAAAAAAALATDLGDAPRYSRFSRKDDRRKPGRAPADDADHAGFASRHASGGLRRPDMDPTTMQLDELRGEISQLCRDQFGCRFLQKKLDEGVPAQCDLIFEETFPYFAELMTDPFGNYLCQKLLEHCSDAQRDQIVEAIAHDLVAISLNMHGTRAVQKTIDFVSTPAQTEAIIQAFSCHVVSLIKDLNGNHVIQKCLNRLSASDNQFIYDAVAAKCVDVATHRHGCCVLQRCIDHASETQRRQLVQEITMYSQTLVQDPFGNYVVQYVLDLDDPAFTQSVTQQFLGHVFQLSTQKFSSNVMEKCIRVAAPPLRQQLIAELVDAAKLESLLRDSFANYVVQTCLDYAEPAQREQLVECIRPILPAIRNTPYGKRIQSKLQRDGSEHPPRYRSSEPRHTRGAPATHGAPHHHAPHSRGGRGGGAGGGRGARPRKFDGGKPNSGLPDEGADPADALYAPLRRLYLGGPHGASGAPGQADVALAAARGGAQPW